MPKTLMLIGAHADDCEIGAGGLMLQAIAAGCRVVVVSVVGDFTTWAGTANRAPSTRAAFLDIARRYGYEKIFLNYPYHHIDGGDLPLKQELSRLYNEIRPDTGFIHHIEDNYADHVACHHAGHYAMYFAHGLSGDLNAPRIPRIYAFSITPYQTYHFQPDVYYNITDVMPRYMDLLNEHDGAYMGLSQEEVIQHELKNLRDPTGNLRLGTHSWTKFAECLQFGSKFGCRYAQGFKQIWGPQPGAQLW